MSYVEYEERYVGFLDILGFSNIVQNLSSGDELIRIYALLATAKFAATTLEDPQVVLATSFSDNIVVSAPTTAEGLAAIVHFSFQAGWMALLKGYLIRGGIVKGLLHHSNEAVFGTGLVEAYQIESKIADVPRIVVASTVVEDFKKHIDHNKYIGRFSQHLLQDKDGHAYLDVFASIGNAKSTFWALKPDHDEAWVSPEEDAMYRSGLRQEIAATLKRLLDATTDQTTANKKVRWLADEFQARTNFTVGR